MRFREVVLLAALGCAALSGPAWAQTPGRWDAHGRIAANRPADLACAGTSLCVAVDAGGDVITSTHPLRHGATWRTARVEPGTRLWAVSCPSRSLCVAVDDAGRVLTSSHPSGGRRAWRAGRVHPGGLFDVSCPSVRLCVAVGGQDVAFSTRPRAGARSWRVVRGVDQAVAPDCARYGGDDADCAMPDLLSVSCPSTSFCAAADSLGSDVTSDAPGRASGWPRSGNAAAGLADGSVACLGIHRCLLNCAVGAGTFGTACPGPSYATGDIETLQNRAISVAYHTVSPDTLAGLWCASAQICFAADAPGSLFASVDPGNPSAAWMQVISAPTGAGGPRRIVGVACLTPRACLAIDTAGRLHEGPPPASAGQIRRALRPVLRHAFLRHGRARTLTVHAPLAGGLLIVWYRDHSREVLAYAAGTFSAAGVRPLPITLTRRGRAVFRRHRPPPLTAMAAFAPALPAGIPHGRPVRVTAPVGSGAS